MSFQVKKRIFSVLVIIALVLLIINTFPDEPNMVSSTYSNVSYYNKNHAKRYKKYHKKMKNLSEEEVIWHVNNNLDYPFYEKTEKIDINDKNPLLVNKYHKLPDNFVPIDLVQIEQDHQATSKTKVAFDKLKKQASSNGLSFKVVVAYRSIDYQKQLYNKYINEDGQELADTYSARPGYSEHHTGRTLDVSSANNDMLKFGETPESTWLIQHAHEYGFIIRYKSDNIAITGYKPEPWHITFVGTKVAKVMRDENIQSLEQYVAIYRPNLLAKE